MPVRSPSLSPTARGLTRVPPSLPRRLLQPEYAALAKQWSSAGKGQDEEHFFAYLDFQNGPEVFQRVRRLPVRPHLLESSEG